MNDRAMTGVGWGLIVGAVALTLYNISDTVTDLANWHAATTPAFVGAALKQVASTLLGVLGGAALPQGGGMKARTNVIVGLVATQVDAGIAGVVFAVDDAAASLCKAGVLNKAQCDRLNAPMVNALKDVRALTVAIQAMPANGAVPHSLPDLIADLNGVQSVVNDLGAGPTFKPVSDALLAAENSVTALLKKLIGG
jgi:hypothetical protein